MAETEKGERTRNRIYSTSGIFDYFHRFFMVSSLPSRSIIAAFFLVFLIVPIMGGPSRDSAARLESGIVFIGLNTVFYLTGAVLFRFNRGLDDHQLKRSGKVVLAMIIASILVYSASALLTLGLGSEVMPVLRIGSSAVIIVPLVLVITLLVESVIRRGIVQSDSRVPLLLVFLTILLIMYTFATIYFVNGLLLRTDVFTGSTTLLPVSFGDALYFSGLIFTTLGSSDIFPVGIGKAVMLFESVSGYLVLGFLTAIFIQAIISARESGRS
jgi:hypothetical protein